MRNKLLAVLASVSSLAPLAADARVVRFDVEQTRPFAEGKSFGRVGQYEALKGTAHMEVDPRDPLNAVIVDLNKAPRNARGMVEFSSPFYIVKPTDMSRGNHKMFYIVNNRGNGGYMSRFNYAPSVNEPITAEDAGDGFLMRLGYAIVDAGWQGDVVAGNDRLFPDLPIAARRDGRPIVGRVRIEYSDRTIPQEGTFTLTLEGSPNFESYPAADTNTANSTLTVRDTVDGAKTIIPPDRWAFGTCPTGAASLVVDATNICLFDGFRADKLYELIYKAKNPKVMGLGYAVTRDIGSFLRYRTQDDYGNPNPLAQSSAMVGIRRSYTMGISSTGMYMRDFIYLGFNEDEEHHKVFDVVWPSTPGTHRLFANVRFADPNTYSRQDDRHDFLSTSYPPLTWGVRTDPVSGIRDGILKRPNTDPLVIQTVTDTEFWQFRASLDVADGLGHPIRQPRNVRLYFLSGFDHGSGLPAAFPGERGICQNLTNPQYHGPSYRAILKALDLWADRGVRPPRSNYPSVRKGTLVTLDEAGEAFPDIPGVSFPTVLNELELLDFGRYFDSEGGILKKLPPSRGPSYQVLLPKPDKDGQSIAGIRPMEVRVPLGTHTGWNIRAAGFRESNLCGLSGSYIPFAKTRRERIASGDPRESLKERYHSHRGYVRAVKRAAKELVRERFLLTEDAYRFIKEAKDSDVLKHEQEGGHWHGHKYGDWRRP